MFKSCISKRNILLYLKSATSYLPYVTRLKVVFVLAAAFVTEESCVLSLVPQRTSDLEMCNRVVVVVKMSVMRCFARLSVSLSDGNIMAILLSCESY